MNRNNLTYLTYSVSQLNLVRNVGKCLQISFTSTHFPQTRRDP